MKQTEMIRNNHTAETGGAGNGSGAMRRIKQGLYLGGSALCLGAAAILPLSSASCSKNPVATVAQDTVKQTFTTIYNVNLPSAVQCVVDKYVDSVLVAEQATFDPPLRTVSDAQGNVTGLPEGRYYVGFMKQGYMLLSVLADRIQIGQRSAADGIINQGESLQADSLTFRLDDLSNGADGPAAIISILNGSNSLIQENKIYQGQSASFATSLGSGIFHVYQVAPGYTFGKKWADAGVFLTDSFLTLQTDALYYPAASGPHKYSFTMEWGTGNTLKGWELRLQ